MESFLIMGGGMAVVGVVCIIWMKWEDHKYGPLGSERAVAA